jgi:RNA 2',3'-cyclic 3'-phosphodiesterase
VPGGSSSAPRSLRQAVTMDRTRTFVALRVSDGAKQAIAELRRAMPPPPRGLRWAPVEQAHLTLAFLGDLDGPALAEVGRRARAAAFASTPFDADLRAVGAFPRAERARVVWVGWGSGGDAVVALQSALARELESAGLGREEGRPFTPHVTVARARSALDLRDWLAAAPEWASPGWRADSLDVMASELRRAGAVHTLLERWALGGG